MKFVRKEKFEKLIKQFENSRKTGSRLKSHKYKYLPINY